MNKELKVAIRTLKEIITTKFNLDYSIDSTDKEAIETVLEELKRLQAENNKLERANKTYINSIQSITPVLLEAYIEKDKIREKIKELQKKYEIALEENSTKAFILKCQITILEELLEEK